MSSLARLSPPLQRSAPSPAFHAHFSVVPLHPAEIDFKLMFGSEVLFERLAAAGASDLVDLARQPVA